MFMEPPIIFSEIEPSISATENHAVVSSRIIQRYWPAFDSQNAFVRENERPGNATEQRSAALWQWLHSGGARRQIRHQTSATQDIPALGQHHISRERAQVRTQIENAIVGRRGLIPIRDGNVPRELKLANVRLPDKRLRRSYVACSFLPLVMDGQETTFDRGIAEHDLRPVDVTSVDGDTSDGLKLGQASFDLQSLVAILREALQRIGGKRLRS
jgi:hypothetical protein